MPVSKKRKKKGKAVKRGDDRLTGVTLQDLINVLAYQEAHPEEAKGLDFEDPDTQAVIKAVAARDKLDDKVEDQDGR